MSTEHLIPVAGVEFLRRRRATCPRRMKACRKLQRLTTHMEQGRRMSVESTPRQVNLRTAAAFHRAGALWVIFDKPSQQDVARLKAAAGDAVRTSTWFSTNVPSRAPICRASSPDAARGMTTTRRAAPIKHVTHQAPPRGALPR